VTCTRGIKNFTVEPREGNQRERFTKRWGEESARIPLLLRTERGETQGGEIYRIVRSFGNTYPRLVIKAESRLEQIAAPILNEGLLKALLPCFKKCGLLAGVNRRISGTADGGRMFRRVPCYSAWCVGRVRRRKGGGWGGKGRSFRDT